MSRVPESLYSIKGGKFQAIELPLIKEVRGKEWMTYGLANLFPQSLIEVYNTSAMHQTAVHAVTDAIVGQGFLKVGSEHVNLDGETLDIVFKKVALDYVLFGGYSLNLVWNKEGTRVAELYHIPFANVRSGQKNEDGDITHYYYGEDWTNVRKYKPREYRKFSPTDNKGDNASQIYYTYDYQPGQDFYPLPSYMGALTDCELDGRISRWHNQNLKNGLSPSMFIQFRSGIPTNDERQKIYSELDQSFSGEENAGKFFMSFSRPGEEMEITPVENTTSDYYTVLEQRITSRIMTAHRITSAKLLGISEASGFSNNAEEIVVAYQHFLATTIKPKQETLTTSLEFVLRFIGLNVNLHIIPNEILPTVAEKIEIKEKIEE
tara:strand:- start:2130 stop:3260 length:1131 start_codon:yes stop_codon:yes gene_type:complete